MAPLSLPERDSAAYLSEDTIAALSTPVGGAIALIRVSGPKSILLLEALTRIQPIVSRTPRKLYRARLQEIQSDRMLDDTLFAYFLAPLSYTGENLVEIHIHGGAYIATRVLEEIFKFGVRPALPGEFSFRAVRNGKLSLSQAQAVSELISASNDAAISLALEKLSGTQNRLLQGISDELKSLAAFSEIGIDFADQDIEEVGLPRLKLRAQVCLESILRLADSFNRGSKVQDGIRAAFLGIPNAGKSSFFNALLGEDRSIVSELAGTTRDVVREKLTLRGISQSISLRLEDTAGLRVAEHPIEHEGIQRTLRAAQDADLLLFLVDPLSNLNAVRDEWAKIDPSHRWTEKTLGVFTKSDQVGADQISQVRNELVSLGIQTWVSVSAVTGAGLPEATETILKFCERWVHRSPGEILLTRWEHCQAALAAGEDLKRALVADEIELFASDLRQALHSLSPLIGQTVPDDILGKIFSEFCIGK